MSACREIRPWLEWLAADEIAYDRRRAVEAHVSACPACGRELAAWRALLDAAAQPDAALNAEMQAVDWEAVSKRIAARAAAAGKTVRMPVRRRTFSLMPLAAAAALTAVGLLIFFQLQQRRGVPAGPGGGENHAASVSHLQSGLARQEVIAYLQQSQLVFTDLLKDCSGEEMASWEIRLYSRQAKELLLRKKYVQQSLPPVEWLRIRQVAERIDWLNYEILQLEDRQLCGQIHRLQRVLEAEKLLLKIRLLERDLSSQPYIEA
jgi:anti-sigma factor RsiW